MLLEHPHADIRTAAFTEPLTSLARLIAFAAVIGIAYFLAARLSLALLTKPDGVAVFWPAAGIACGVLISFGAVARWPVVIGVMAATFVANLLGDRNIWSATVFAMCNAGEAVLAAALIQRYFGSSFNLDMLRNVLAFIGVALIATALSGIGGTLGYVFFHTGEPAFTVWRHWFASDAIGIVATAPILIELGSAIRDPPSRRQITEGVLALVALTALSGTVVYLPSEAWALVIIIAALFPLLLWIGARCTVFFSAAAIFIFSLTVVWTTTFGIGVFGNLDVSAESRILSAQIIILAEAFCALVLAALFSERRQHVTSLLQIQQRLREALKAAREADHAKTSFLAAASHDLRQPLQTLNLLQAALKAHIQEPAGRALLVGMARSIDVMNGMLISLLDINRLEAGTLRPEFTDFPIKDVFDSVAADFLVPIVDKGLRLRVIPSSIWIRSDRRMLEEMLRNLFSNAVRYTDRGTILVGCRRTGDRAKIQVWDSGVGIMGEHVPHIFEEYYQVPSTVQLGGFGLGLSIVQRIAKILDHPVKVSSTPGKGSGFSIEVPLAGKTSATAPSANEYEAIADENLSGTALIVEDEGAVRAATASLLRSYGLDVHAVSTVDEALRLVADNGTAVPNIILCDYNLPGKMNGVEGIMALRETIGEKVPSIVLTGDSRKEVTDTIAAHRICLATKPIRADALLRLVGSMLPK